MDDQLQRRLARNESVFREVNEGIERGQWPGEDKAVGFRCECAQFGCNLLVNLTVVEYERVRAHPRRFLVVPGHERPAIESVVERNTRYTVVQKRGEAGEKAEARDPRS